jgi:hypothetical protein
MTGGFARLIRVDPDQRRKNIGIYVMQAALKQENVEEWTIA